MEGESVYAAPGSQPQPPRSNRSNCGKCPEVPGQRLYFLDWLRLGAFGLLLLYHVGMYYVSWPFHVKSPNTVAGLEAWMKLAEPWRMSLVFLVSGAATAHMCRHGKMSGRLLLRRTRFLLLPLLTGVVLIVPPQTYFEVVQKFGYTGGFLAFLGLYFSHDQRFCDGMTCLTMPTWNHLWFLPYLWSYTVVLFGVRAWFPDTARAVSTAVANALRGPGLFLLPTAWLAVWRVAMYPHHPPTHALWNDVYGHAVYGFAFVMGGLFMRMDSVWPRLRAARHPAMVTALLAWASLVFMHPSRLSEQLLTAVFQWSAIVALVGYSAAHLDRDAPSRAMLTEAVYPVYIVHQTVMILLSQALLGLQLPAAKEACILLSATAGLSFGFYLLVRRQRLLRPWLGLRSHRA